ncbi:thioredoxin family protein [Aquabacterium sp.]|uniref:thioredoxin family protein n=1 Tax=Aquabacterium sp. TaxID=1872578 RepID=UPI003D6CAF3D
MSPASAPASSSLAVPALDVVCLCAAWCGTCGEYEAVFKALKNALPGHRYRWIDIEDESDLIGDIDVETFPTLLVAWQGQVLFAGPVLPRLGDAQRLLQVRVDGLASGEAPTALSGLLPDQAAAYQALAREVARPSSSG